MKIRGLVLPAILVIVSLLAACGGGDDDEESTYCPPPAYDYGDGRGCVNEPISSGGGGQG